MDQRAKSSRTETSDELDAPEGPTLVQTAVCSKPTPDDLNDAYFANVIWGARCGKSARRVLLGETRSSGHAYSVRGARESVALRQAPQGLPSSRLVSTIPFDVWMARQFPHLPFERYADDAIVHCRTRREAEEVRNAVAQRLQECRLELHPEKTKIVYCKDEDRRGNYPNQKFDFLGYTFRPRKSKNRWGKLFANFTPAISTRAAKAIRDEIRGWRLQSCSDQSIEALSRMFNPIIRGWLQYYGDSIALRCICRYSNWTKRWRVGRHRNTRAFAVVNDVHINGSPGCPGVLRRCSLTGRW